MSEEEQTEFQRGLDVGESLGWEAAINAAVKKLPKKVEVNRYYDKGCIIPSGTETIFIHDMLNSLLRK